MLLCNQLLQSAKINHPAQNSSSGNDFGEPRNIIPVNMNSEVLEDQLNTIFNEKEDISVVNIDQL